jgi:acetyl esterase/lipase
MTSSSELILLWPDGVPPPGLPDGTATPSLTIFEPAPGHATGAAVVVCPGGGYMNLAS